MNQRFKELYEKATGKSWTYDFDPETAELFCLLIVKECADVAEKWYSNYPTDDRLVSETVKQHFGVEK